MARQIQRWEHDDNYGPADDAMYKDAEGDYVLWDDVAPLLEELDRSTAQQAQPAIPALVEKWLDDQPITPTYYERSMVRDFAAWAQEQSGG